MTPEQIAAKVAILKDLREFLKENYTPELKEIALTTNKAIEAGEKLI